MPTGGWAKRPEADLAAGDLEDLSVHGAALDTAKDEVADGDAMEPHAESNGAPVSMQQRLIARPDASASSHG